MDTASIKSSLSSRERDRLERAVSDEFVSVSFTIVAGRMPLSLQHGGFGGSLEDRGFSVFAKLPVECRRSSATCSSSGFSGISWRVCRKRTSAILCLLRLGRDFRLALFRRKVLKSIPLLQLSTR